MQITFSRNENLNFFSRTLFIVATIISILLVLFSLCDLKSVNLNGDGFYKINIFNLLVLGIIGGIGAANSFFFKYRSYGFILIVVSFFLIFTGLLSLIVLGFEFISHKNLPAYNYNKLAPINFLFSLNIILFSAKNILEELKMNNKFLTNNLHSISFFSFLININFLITILFEGAIHEKLFFSSQFTFTEILLWCILFFAQALIVNGSYLEYLYNNLKSFISLFAISSLLFIILNFVLIKFYNSKSLELSEVYIYSFSIGTLLINLIIVFIVKRIQSFNENSNIQSLSSTSKELILERNMKIHYEELMLQEAKMIQINEELVGTLKDLEDKNFELDQFVYKTSHDLRSPLTTVLGLINLMKEESNNVTNIYYSSLIEDRVLKLDNFIKAMLEYSRNTRAEIIIEPIDFRYIIEDCFSDLEYVPHFKEVNKIINIYGEGIIFNSDVFRLKTVFINLISNSIKYRNPLSNFSHIKIKVTILPGNTEIRIYDNGIGIKNEHLPKIFDMFYRATNKSDGSGLGMYIVKQTVDKLKGNISIESSFGAYSEVIINIPDLKSKF